MAVSEREEPAAGGGALRERLRGVYWIGGGSGAGKSTIARRLAEAHGLQLYATDDAMAEHAGRSTPEECPLLHAFLAMDMDERWLKRPPAAMLATFPWFHGEAFERIVEDLAVLSAGGGGVIAEGFRLLPHLVSPLLAAPEQAVWLLPTPAFRRAAIERRGGCRSGFLARTSDPEGALRNLLERDALFTDGLRSDVERLGLASIEVDGGMAEDDTVGLVTRRFGL